MLRPDPAPPGFTAGVAGRGLRPDAPLPYPAEASVWMGQVHGTDLREAGGPGALPACDAVHSRERGLWLTVQVADCLPLLLASPGEGSAAVHAGWRGLAGGVIEAALARFRHPDALTVWLGPAIGPCCFEVGPEVAARFPETARRPGPRDRPHVDLFTAARERLTAGGVPAAAISAPGPCTRCHQHLLHSHRGSGGAPGRNVAFIGPAPADQSQSP